MSPNRVNGLLPEHSTEKKRKQQNTVMPILMLECRQMINTMGPAIGKPNNVAATSRTEKKQQSSISLRPEPDNRHASATTSSSSSSLLKSRLKRTQRPSPGGINPHAFDAFYEAGKQNITEKKRSSSSSSALLLSAKRQKRTLSDAFILDLTTLPSSSDDDDDNSANKVTNQKPPLSKQGIHMHRIVARKQLLIKKPENRCNAQQQPLVLQTVSQSVASSQRQQSPPPPPPRQKYSSQRQTAGQSSCSSSTPLYDHITATMRPQHHHQLKRPPPTTTCATGDSTTTTSTADACQKQPYRHDYDDDDEDDSSHADTKVKANDQQWHRKRSHRRNGTALEPRQPQVAAVTLPKHRLLPNSLRANKHQQHDHQQHHPPCPTKPHLSTCTPVALRDCAQPPDRPHAARASASLEVIEILDDDDDEKDESSSSFEQLFVRIEKPENPTIIKQSVKAKPVPHYPPPPPPPPAVAAAAIPAVAQLSGTHTAASAAHYKFSFSDDDDDNDDDDNDGVDETNVQATVAASLKDDALYAPPPSSHDLPPIFSVQEFVQMIELAELNHGLTTEDLEKGALVTGANTKMNKQDTQQQDKAQYGRLMPMACDDLLRNILDVQPNEVFIDIGHGIGSLVLQAAYTIGCQGRGIEVVEDRNFLATLFYNELEEQRIQLHENRDGRKTNVGSVEFRRGELQDPNHRDFLTVGPNGECCKVFCNNFNGVFTFRSAKRTQMYYLDHFVAGLFALLRPGSALVTLHQLPFPVPCLDRANEIRKNHRLPQRPDASFYKMEAISIGQAKDVVSWSYYGGGCTHEIIVYKYTRIKQEKAPSGKASFLCCNGKCNCAIRGLWLPATMEVDQDGPSKIVVTDECECKNPFPGNGQTRRSRMPLATKA